MTDPIRAMSEHLKLGIDSLSIATVAATLAQWLPSVAALFSVIWTSIRIYETATVQRWLGRAPIAPGGAGDD